MAPDYRGIRKLASQFTVVNRIRFSGRLNVITAEAAQRWSFYFHLGRLVYATGGPHSARRWYRNLRRYCPQVNLEAVSVEITEAEPWDYQLLCLLIKSKQIRMSQAKAMIQNLAAEVLFDILQVGGPICQIERLDQLKVQLALLEMTEPFKEFQQAWKLWQSSGLSDHSPNLAPVLRQPKGLQQQLSPAAYQALANLVDGQRTLRDLALRTQQEVAQVARALFPYLQSGLVELVELPDLPPPSLRLAPVLPVRVVPEAPPSAPLVACLDDSPAICQELETIITQAGYRFMAIQDPLRAVALLFAHRPDLIFLDLVMPTTSGYEICSMLRKTSIFRNTPVVILTGNDGIVERVRAKIAGASDFLGKPVERGPVLSAIQKHLAQLPSLVV